MKGVSVGGAVVSEVHANFIVNQGQASSFDVVSLLEHMATAVEKQSGVILERELVVW